MALQGSFAIGKLPVWPTKLVNNDNFDVQVNNISKNTELSLDEVAINFTDADTGNEINPFHLPIEIPSITTGTENAPVDPSSDPVYDNATQGWWPTRVGNQNLRGGQSYDMTIKVVASNNNGQQKVFAFYSRLVVEG